jgi:formate-dependent nitrite reductase membrane component NrfD
MRVSSVALVAEIVALALVIVSIRAAGSAGADAALGQLVTGPFSIAFWLGAVFLGAVLPLLLGTIGRSALTMTALRATLVLVGGFLIKFVLIDAGQASLNGVG